MVVANAVAALSEVQESSNIIQSFALGSNTVYKLLAALNECTEWGQVIILDSISSYSPQNESQAESIIERVTPRLQHANCAVVLSAAKVIVSQLEVRGGSSESAKQCITWSAKFTLKNIFMNMQGVQNSNTVSNVIR